MASLDSWQRQLSDLHLDLSIERDKLSALVRCLERLEGLMEASSGSSETVDSAALRLQSLYTGVERCLLVRKAIATESRPAVLSPAVLLGLAELLAFRHLVRHLYAYELEADRVRLLLQWAIAQKRTGEGMTKREILRCLKRFIAREVYWPLLSDPSETSVTC